jgi:hypothetical protein
LERPLSVPRHRLALILAGLLAVLIVSAGAVRFWPRTDLVEGHAYPVPSSASGRVVEVLNGTDRMGLARITTRLLRHAGYDVVLFKNAPEPADSTDILVRRGELAAGQRIRSTLGIGRVRIAPDTLLRVDVSVILGSDYLPVAELHP